MWPWTSLRRAATVERLDPQSAYSRWAAAYPPRPHNRLMEVEQRTVLSLIGNVAGLTVLDAGCGSGRYLRELGSRGAVAMGVDLSRAMLSRAKLESTKVARADVRAIPLSGASVDVVVCGLALGDFVELELALSEFARVVRPGGFVIYSVVHPDGESQGWARTFESDGRQWAVEGVWHSLDRHRKACAAAGITISDWCEPELEQVPGHRALLVVRARR